MIIKNFFSILTLILSITSINTKNLFNLDKQSLLNILNNNDRNSENNNANNVNNKNDFNYRQLFSDIFGKFYKECSEDLKKMDPLNYNINTPPTFPMLLTHTGLTFNDIQDEVECKSYKNSTYILAVTQIIFRNEDDRILLHFLDLKYYTVTACGTDLCKNPLIDLATIYANFDENKNKTKEEEKKSPEITIDNDNEYKKNKVFEVFVWIFVAYVLIKIIVGTIRIIYIPKGYDIYVAKILNEQGKLPFFDEKKERYSLDSQEKKEFEYSNPKEYNPDFDLTEYLPKYLRVIKFFDFFNDYMILSSRRNRYYNDNGLEIIILLRAIVLFFFIFTTTFNTLLNLPTNDILNKAFFSSYSLFFYRFSTNSGVCWIFLEAAFATYKLMKYIEKKMKEYNQGNKFKGYFTNLLIIYGQFLLLFIPKICTFIFCYLIFYTDIMKFKSLFSSNTIFRHVVEKRITNDIECNNRTSLIFSSLFTFTNKAEDFNKCYDFTFIYINIFYCFLFFMITTLIIFMIKKSMFEIYLIAAYLFLFFSLIKIVDDDKYETLNLDGEYKIYSYYHFKGQEYTTKVVYLTLGFYTLGFIFGILCYNYDNYKKVWNTRKNKNNKNNTNNYNNIKDTNNLVELNKDINNNIIEKSGNSLNMSDTFSSVQTLKSLNSKNSIKYQRMEYYPLSALTGVLKSINDLKPRTKTIIIIICLLFQIFLSFFFKIYSVITKNSKKSQYKNLLNYDRNYVLLMEFNWVLQGYFLCEKHIFLILFFIICLILITVKQKGVFKTLFKSSLITAISRAGFTMVCLSYILANFSFCGFLVKIKFSIPTFIIISIGNFIIIFVICLSINIVFELPIRIGIKKIFRMTNKKKYNLQESKNFDNSINFSRESSSIYSQK